MVFILLFYILQIIYCDVKLTTFKYYDIKSVHLILNDNGIRMGGKQRHLLYKSIPWRYGGFRSRALQ